MKTEMLRNKPLTLTLKIDKVCFDALMENYKPENRNYKYDFFYDNCATRIVDIVADNIDGKLVFSGFDKNKEQEYVSFRDYLHHYLKNSLWIETGLNMILGLPADKTATKKESTYLPDFLMSTLNEAYILSENGKKESLVKQKDELLNFDIKPQEDRFWHYPFFVFSLVLFISVIVTLFFKIQLPFILDRFLFCVAWCNRPF